MRSFLVCSFYRIGYSRSFITLSELMIAAPYMELYCQLSAIDNIVLPRFHRRGHSDLRRARLRISWSELRMELITRERFGRKEERRKHAHTDNYGSSDLNRSQATNGSTLSIGYVHRETQRKGRLSYISTGKRNNIWLLKATSLR